MAASSASTAMDNPVYTIEQLDAYFERINVSSRFNRDDRSLEALTILIRQQLLNVPFETLALHYSVDRTISLDPAALFDKIVTRRRGGYCLENNTFFGCVLRSLGFSVYGVICRISKATWGVHDGSWRPMSHMANIVMLDGLKYLVDVGYGVDGPTIPIPLDASLKAEDASNRANDALSHTGFPGQKIKLELKNLPQHIDPSQKVWVYSQRRFMDNWEDVYHFADMEVLPHDFEVLNFYNMTNSLWARTVVAQRFRGSEISIDGTLMLVRHELRRGDGSRTEPIIMKTYQTEAQRLEALRWNFGIILSEEEQRAIKGRPTELTGSELP
ncbi:hypothetical protein F5X68DRAFT_209143 [Plectosphaerella plurivora]|uniref:Arylamine N-acetyltransferase n=1 Tax=Plectosphaerella plurivora TaxID=936078 RepID=A0A9P8V9C7_9PEZI|nr:hypothetical protein F5X68DRAFT_209143 [Plectosphaerella plurivora]